MRRLVPKTVVRLNHHTTVSVLSGLCGRKLEARKVPKNSYGLEGRCRQRDAIQDLANAALPLSHFAKCAKNCCLKGA
jgi:hypothetical protein